MNTFNRVVMVILFLLAIPLLTLLLVVPVPALQAISAYAAAWARGLSAMSLYIRLFAGVLLSLIVDFVLVLMVVLEVRRKRPKAIEVDQLDGGQVLVNADSVADRLRYEVDLLPGVLRTTPSVGVKKGGVVVDLDVEAAAGINVSDSAQPIVETVQDVVENKLGLRMARPPKVRLHTVGYPKAYKAPLGQAPAGAQAAPSAVEPAPSEPPEPDSSEAPVEAESSASQAGEEAS